MKKRLLLILGVLVGILVFTQQYSQFPLANVFAQASIEKTTEHIKPVRHDVPHFRKVRSRKISI